MDIELVSYRDNTIQSLNKEIKQGTATLSSNLLGSDWFERPIDDWKLDYILNKP